MAALRARRECGGEKPAAAEEEKGYGGSSCKKEETSMRAKIVMLFARLFGVPVKLRETNLGHSG